MPQQSLIAHVDKQVQLVTQAVLNLLFPPRCAGCRKPGVEFCDECIRALVPTGPVLCSTCGEPLNRPGLCVHCQAGGHSFHQIRSAFRFEGPLRSAVHALKYENRRSVALPLAHQMSAVLTRPDPAGAILAPVPLHPDRFRQRGYNQSAELARHLGDAWGVACLPFDILQRTRATGSQVELDRAARQQNVDGAFGVSDPSKVAGLQVVLVDDVCTTGATLDACARALLAAGARVVDGVTLARQV